MKKRQNARKRQPLNPRQNNKLNNKKTVKMFSSTITSKAPQPMPPMLPTVYTHLTDDACTINDQDIANNSWSQRQLVSPVHRSNMPVLGKPTQQVNVHGSMGKDFAMEANLQRGTGAVLSRCSQQQHQAAPLVAYPWQSIQTQTPPVTVQSHPIGKSAQNDLDVIGNQQFADRPFIVRASGAIAPRVGEQPKTFSLGTDTYMDSMKQLEQQQRQELAQKRAHEASVRQYYRTHKVFQPAFS